MFESSHVGLIVGASVGSAVVGDADGALLGLAVVGCNVGVTKKHFVCQEIMHTKQKLLYNQFSLTSDVGERDGLEEGEAVGLAVVGSSVGDFDGRDVGDLLGLAVVGSFVGDLVGLVDGESVGFWLGLAVVGSSVGVLVGFVDGASVGFSVVGAGVGLVEGDLLGAAEGAAVKIRGSGTKRGVGAPVPNLLSSSQGSLSPVTLTKIVALAQSPLSSHAS